MDISRIGVVGAGMMGSEIALVFALAGKNVLLSDAVAGKADAAIESLKQTLSRGIERKFWSKDQADTAINNITVTDPLEDFADRQFIVEAVFEDYDVKTGINQKLAGIVNEHCLIATNTSTIPITSLSGGLMSQQRPNYIGTHFFSPVSRMKLVEVIPSSETDPAVVEKTCKLMREIGKTPIEVKDVVGFAVNRMLHAFVIEAIRLVEEGVATIEDIDTAAKLGLGHPVGPFELLDAVTNNLSLQAQEIMYQAYGPRFLPRPMLKTLVRAGYSGRKCGRGWYHYKNGRRI
jgi:3-hydroxybutyryl-CoA dehydrogenase